MSRKLYKILGVEVLRLLWSCNVEPDQAWNKGKARRIEKCDILIDIQCNHS